MGLRRSCLLMPPPSGPHERRGSFAMTVILHDRIPTYVERLGNTLCHSAADIFVGAHSTLMGVQAECQKLLM
jgi:hypothetical protein